MGQAFENRAVLIAGPTASGKSAVALERAQRSGGLIVNADALQVYDGLNVLTARPSAADAAQAPHRLYGFVDPSVRFSTGAWLRAAQDVVAAATAGGRELIFAGGTGLYFEALLGGIARVPAVPPAVVAALTEEVAALDRAGRMALLSARDPQMLTLLREPDQQRLVRALAVKAHTGRSLAEYVGEGQAGLLGGWSLERIVLAPTREERRERIARRFEAMLEQGAVEEVRALLARGLGPGLPAMKAIGVRQIGDWLAGRISRDEMVTLAVIATRQFAKRQMTWFRNRMAEWTWVEV